jgi:polysaccharide export outer membrane protein
MRIVYLFAVFSFILASCSYKQDQVLFAQKGQMPDTTQLKSLANISNYQIKPQDILQITNMQNSKNIIDLSAGVLATGGAAANPSSLEVYTVEEDGTISLTGIGRVQVAGLTRIQARKRIEELYSKDLKQPLLEVKIINLKASIFGEVRSPGNLPLIKDRTTLVELIGEAGGLTEKADEKTIKIIRNNDQNNPRVEVIDLGNIKSLTDPRTLIQNGDVIYVAQNHKAVRNANISNFSILIQPALILLNTALIIFTLSRR